MPPPKVAAVIQEFRAATGRPHTVALRLAFPLRDTVLRRARTCSVRGPAETAKSVQAINSTHALEEIRASTQAVKINAKTTSSRCRAMRSLTQALGTESRRTATRSQTRQVGDPCTVALATRRPFVEAPI